MVKKIGITGNIGSGKTTVCRIFESMGISVCYADELARELMIRRLDLRAQILEIFGSSAYHLNGSLNRKVIASQLFTDIEKKEALESKVHPAVHAYLKHWFSRQNGPYALEEAALIFESGGHTQLDQVIWVDAPLELRIQRVMQRDGIDRDAALQREKNQWPAEKKKDSAHYIIKNNEKQMLIPQVQQIHQKIISS